MVLLKMPTRPSPSSSDPTLSCGGAGLRLRGLKGNTLFRCVPGGARSLERLLLSIGGSAEGVLREVCVLRVAMVGMHKRTGPERGATASTTNASTRVGNSTHEVLRLYSVLFMSKYYNISEEATGIWENIVLNGSLGCAKGSSEFGNGSFVQPRALFGRATRSAGRTVSISGRRGADKKLGPLLKERLCLLFQAESP